MRGWNTGHPHSVSHQRLWLKGVVRYEGQLISERSPPTTGQPAIHPTSSHFPIATATAEVGRLSVGMAIQSFGWFSKFPIGAGPVRIRLSELLYDFRSLAGFES